MFNDLIDANPLETHRALLDALFDEVRGTHAYAALEPETWQAVLDFIVQGGQALSSYPDFRRVVRGDDAEAVAQLPGAGGIGEIENHRHALLLDSQR